MARYHHLAPSCVYVHKASDLVDSQILAVALTRPREKVEVITLGTSDFVAIGRTIIEIRWMRGS